jgi:hypothetical protein
MSARGQKETTCHVRCNVSFSQKRPLRPSHLATCDVARLGRKRRATRRRDMVPSTLRVLIMRAPGKKITAASPSIVAASGFHPLAGSTCPIKQLLPSGTPS